MNFSEQRFANKAGEEYDLFGLALPHELEIQRKTAELVSNHFPKEVPKLKVLEIGYGTGLTSKELLKDGRIELIAIDNEPTMKEKALAKLEPFSETRFTLQTIDAFDYLKRQPDQTFDAVATAWMLHNLFNDFRSQILKEIYRTLKTGGIFVNGDKLAVADPDLHKSHLDWQMKQFEVYEKMNRLDLKKEWTEHYLEDENPDRILYENKFIQELTVLGFTNCQVTDRHYLDAIASAVKSQ